MPFYNKSKNNLTLAKAIIAGWNINSESEKRNKENLKLILNSLDPTYGNSVFIDKIATFLDLPLLNVTKNQYYCVR